MAKSLFGPQFHNSISKSSAPNIQQRHSTSWGCFPGDSKQGTHQSSPALRRKPQNLWEEPPKFPFGKSLVQDHGFVSLWVLLPGRVCHGMRKKTAFGEEAPGADRILASPQMGHGAAKLPKDTRDRAWHGLAALAENYFWGIPQG